jgi:hypothetical protein
LEHEDKFEASLMVAPTLPILIATGYAELPENEGQILPKLPKPLFQVDLANAIARIFEVSGVLSPSIG